MIGLLLTIRNSNLAVLPFLVFMILRNAPSPRRIAILIMTGTVIPIMNTIAFVLLHGHVVFRTYGAEGFTGGLTGIVGSLFSARHGLFIYHPWYAILILLNIIGIMKRGTNKIIPSLALLSFILLWVFNGTWWSWWSWWFGASYGNRAFIESIIPLSFGAAICVKSLKRKTAITIGIILALLNAYLWTGYLLQKYPHDGNHEMSDAYMWIVKGEK